MLNKNEKDVSKNLLISYFQSSIFEENAALSDQTEWHFALEAIRLKLKV